MTITSLAIPRDPARFETLANIWRVCADAGVTIPQEAKDYFGENGPPPAGQTHLPVGTPMHAIVARGESFKVVLAAIKDNTTHLDIKID